MDLELNKKRALVMGSSSGIGKAIAKSLIQEGAEVYLCSRNEEKLKMTMEEVGAQGYQVCDLSKSGSTQNMIESFLEQHGTLDILVTNTGGPQKGNFMEVTDEQWNTDFQSLWMSPVEAMKAVLPSMQKNNYGRIIMVTSIAAKEPLAGLTTSNGLRAGLSGLAKSVANEYSQYGITLNLLLPGYTNTDRLKALNLADEKVKEMVPAGRLADPEELADLATFLASKKGAYITGQSISIDGGVLKGH